MRKSCLFKPAALFCCLSFFLFTGKDAYCAAAKKNNESVSGKDTTTMLQQVAVVAQIKLPYDLRKEPLSSSVIALDDIQKRGIADLHDLSYFTPNLYIPDYGSKMTSSIYIRGLGSRIDNAAVGLYVDRVPYMNKNGFDTDLWDIVRMEVLRGPQSTLYGRNTIGGIINIYTLSPMNYEGVRIKLGYANADTYSAKGSVYHKFNDKWALSLGGNYLNSDGFFTNEYTGEKCDWIEEGSGRARLIFKPRDNLTFDNVFTYSGVRQGGYAYGYFHDGTLDPVNYNDPSSYKRTLLSDGLTINYTAERFLLSSITTWQYIDDCMLLDQDFTTKSMFTLKQAQKEHAITQEFVIRNADEKSKWQWLNGAYLFYKKMEMEAPVLFKSDGIEELFLGPANSGIQSVMPFAELSLMDDEFEISTLFDAPVFGAALYHQSEYGFGRFTLTAGLRFEYEHSCLDYNTFAAISYKFTPFLTEFRSLASMLEGKEKRDYFEPLPKMALSFSLPQKSNVYISVARGFKAGGYNTQIFSDILQSRLQYDMMNDLFSNIPSGMPSGSSGGMGSAMGGSMGSNITPDSIGRMITYKPEYSWNYEVGGHFNMFGNSLRLDASLFFIRCSNQQLTVFPKGTTTGRMMTNAGKTNSLGAELSAFARVWQNLELAVSYGYTKAKFVEYISGNSNYKDKYVPYVPQNTLSAMAEYSFYHLGNAIDKLSLTATYNGIGKIYWNEENTEWQNFYSLLGASVKVQKKFVELELWARNLTDTDYNAFYFVSINNAFFAKGKPAQYGITLSFEF